MHEPLNDCGCCESADSLVPLPIYNRPNLTAIRYRTGTYGEFFESLLARLAAGSLPSLRGLASRQTDDFSISLLDAWSVIADILTFYNERIINEGYLETALERRSLLELGRLVGYVLRPGVAASVWLAYLLDDNATDEVTIPAGAASQSVPGPDELPQTFETSEALKARRIWNNLKPRLLQPQSIFSIMAGQRIYLKSITANLSRNDMLLMDRGPGTGRLPFRVLEAIPEPALDRTTVRIALWAVQPAEPIPQNPPVYQLGELLEKLLQPATQQPPGARRLGRSLNRLLEASEAARNDASLRLLGAFQPGISTTLNTALVNADATPQSPLRVFAMRLRAPLFAHNSPRAPKYNVDGVLEPQPWPEWSLDREEDDLLFLDRKYSQVLPGSILALVRDGENPDIRDDIEVSFVSRSAYGMAGEVTRIRLRDRWWDTASEKVIDTLRTSVVYAAPEELALALEPVETDICGGDAEPIELDGMYPDLEPGRWLIVSGERSDLPGSRGVYASELAMLADVTHGVLPPGVAPDPPIGVEVIGGIGGNLDRPPLPLPGDITHTYLRLARPLAYCYKRATVTIYANVVKATHGETRREVLGSGDGSLPLQKFGLKNGPLTFVPAATPTGVDSSLSIYVNDVEWTEASGLPVLGPRDRKFITKIDDVGRVEIIFGTGERGTRLPTGVENVRAISRAGIGPGGNVKTKQISLLLNRPLGVKEVINPLAATGGAGPENPASARRNIPLAISALDRLVSVQDYADFARTFAGIGKASAIRFNDQGRSGVYLTIAGLDDIPIDVNSDLYRSLKQALRDFGDPNLPVRVDLRELRLLVISAGVAMQPGYPWEVAEPRLRAAMMSRFGFEARDLGQPAYLSEAMAAMQSPADIHPDAIRATLQAVPGVAYVDIDVFTALDEKVVDPVTGELRPILPEDFAALAVQRQERVDARLARVSGGIFQPAQVACLPAQVPEALILNLLEEGA